MPSCVMRRCTNYASKSNKVHGITYHKFPSNEVARQEWVAVVRKQRSEPGWAHTNASTICSAHFDSGYKYTSAKGRILLKKTAVPSLKVRTRSNSPLQYDSPNSVEELDLSDTASVFDSPRKLALKQNNGLRKKITCLKTILKILKEKKYLSEQQYTELNLKSEDIDLDDKEKSVKNLKAKYPPSLRKFALTLNFYSPSAYKYVRRVFDTALPQQRVLGKWCENTTASPGFTKQAFEILKNKSQLSGYRILCTLVADEIALRHPTTWTGKHTDGLVDFGCGPFSTSIATQVYVLVLVCLNENWKIPVGYFFVNSLTGESQAGLLRTCLVKCFESGVDVVALTLNGCASNIAAANLLGCELNDARNLKTTFKHPSCNNHVAVFLDPCRMIKLVRNTFEAKRIMYNDQDKRIRWQLLINLNKLQMNQGLNFANKLSERYIHFRNEIMKVNVATQLLSRSVASDLLLCNELLKSTRFKDTEATVEFINNFNMLFDILNSRARDRFGFKKPMCKHNYREVMGFLEEVKNYILSLGIYTKTRSVVRRRITIKVTKKPIVECTCRTGFLGFLICIESLKHLYCTLVERNFLQYIATYRLSQDHIEMFLGSARGSRGHGEYNNKPNVSQFKGIYKKLVSHVELRSRSKRYCMLLEHFPIVNCLPAMLSLNRSSERQTDDDVEHVDEDITDNSTTSNNEAQKNLEMLAERLNSEQCPDIRNQIVGYISGWIASRLAKSIKCETCTAELYTCSKMWFHKLIWIKDVGGLCYSSENLFTVCLKCETVIKSYVRENGVTITNKQCMESLRNRILKSFVDTNVFNSNYYSEHSRRQPPTLNHRLNLIRIIIEKYLNLRVHFAYNNNPATSEKY